MDDSDDFEVPHQFSPETLAAYLAAAERLGAELARHVEETRARAGRQRELVPFFASADAVRAAAEAFVDAEVDWCGSASLALMPVDDQDDHEDDDEDDDEDDWRTAGRVVSVLTRHDFVVHDDAALLAAGRATYRRMWPDDTQEDAELRVRTPRDAVAELLHENGWDMLDGAPGMDPLQTHQVIHLGDALEDLSELAASALGPLDEDLPG